MAQADSTNSDMDALREKLVREALDDALRMYSPQRRSFLGGLLAAVGLGAFARGDGLPHGGVIKAPVARFGAGLPMVGEARPEMILPNDLARKMEAVAARSVERAIKANNRHTFTVRV